MPDPDPNPFQLREAFYADHFGPLTEPVTHPVDLSEPHIDVYQFRPLGNRRHWTLITGGMSDQRQAIPDELASELAPRAEIMMYVREPKPWMFNVLKGLGEMPSTDKTFLHWFHIVPNGMPMTAEPSQLTNFLFLPPVFESDDFGRLRLEDDRVDILHLVPVTDAESQLAREQGIERLLELFAERGYDLIVNEQRDSFA
jgi:hypothetical protein